MGDLRDDHCQDFGDLSGHWGMLWWYMFELWTIQYDECIFHKVLLTDWLSDRTDYRDAIASKNVSL